MFRSIRQFSTTVRRSNLIQDLYIRELKAFKPTPLPANAAQEATRPWTLPSAAKIPSLEAEGSDSLTEYDNSKVEVSSGSADGAVVEEYKPDDWFVFPPEEELGHH